MAFTDQRPAALAGVGWSLFRRLVCFGHVTSVNFELFVVLDMLSYFVQLIVVGLYGFGQ